MATVPPRVRRSSATAASFAACCARSVVGERVSECVPVGVVGVGDDELGERGCRHGAALGEIAAPHGALAKLPHDTGAIRRDVAVLAARRRRHLDETQAVQKKARELEVLSFRRGLTLDHCAHCGSGSK